MPRNLRIRDERGLVHYARQIQWEPFLVPICPAVVKAVNMLASTASVPLSEMCPDCCALRAREVGIRG